MNPRSLIWSVPALLLAVGCAAQGPASDHASIDGLGGKADDPRAAERPCVSGAYLQGLSTERSADRSWVREQVGQVSDHWDYATEEIQRTLRLPIQHLPAADHRVVAYAADRTAGVPQVTPLPPHSWCWLKSENELVVDSKLAELLSSDDLYVAFYSDFAPVGDRDGSGDGACVWNEGTNFRPCGDCGWQFCLPAGVWSDQCEGKFACGVGGGACEPETGACVGGTVECAGLEVDVRGDVWNCGACGLACPEGTMCDDGMCVGTAFELCLMNSDCAAGEQCVDAWCVLAEGQDH